MITFKPPCQGIHGLMLISIVALLVFLGSSNTRSSEELLTRKQRLLQELNTIDGKLAKIHKHTKASTKQYMEMNDESTQEPVWDNEPEPPSLQTDDDEDDVLTAKAEGEEEIFGLAPVTRAANSLGGPRLAPPLAADYSCRDNSQYAGQCPGWAARGDCQTNSWMLENCKLSCGLCPPPTSPPTYPSQECSDSSSSCPGWAADGECTNNPPWMEDHCKLSCLICGPSPSDVSPNGNDDSTLTSPTSPPPTYAPGECDTITDCGAPSLVEIRGNLSAVFIKETQGNGSSTLCKNVGCQGYKPENDCQCTSSCRNYNNCCNDWEDVCVPKGTCTGGRKKCWDTIKWVLGALKEGSNHYPGLSAESSPEDVQAFYYNGGENGDDKGCPRSCSWKPPQKPNIQQDDSGKPGCPPRDAFPPPPTDSPLQYNGVSWPALCYVGDAEEHVFLYGDWGGNTNFGKNDKPGPAPNIKPGSREKVHGVDDQAQVLIAQQMNRRASSSRPRYVVNGGDNFYWSGIEETCGSKTVHQALLDFERTRLHNTRQFTLDFEQLYSGPGMDGIPWFLVFGNHDYGGFHFHHAWDQQIYYTWANQGRWILPGQYWHQNVQYPTKGFTVDYYMIDSNSLDVEQNPNVDPEHNICSLEHNAGKASCKPWGPADAYDCVQFFKKLYNDQLAWLEKKLKESTADWQIIVTHFPPEPWWRSNAVVPSHQVVKDWKRLGDAYGIDFYVGSHRHRQELYDKEAASRNGKPGIPYVVVGGGGGVTSEDKPGSVSEDAFFSPHSNGNGHPVLKPSSQYGFMDMTISKEKITVVNINYNGEETDRIEVFPRKKALCRELGCGVFKPGQSCQCNEDCPKFNSCCPDYPGWCR